MPDWVDDALQHLDLGDARLNQRLQQTVRSLSAQPQASIPAATADWPEAKAVYRLWSNAHVDPDAILDAQRQHTVERCAEHEVILAVQDSTDLNFRHHPATAGLGALGSGEGRGLKVHSTLAVSGAGVPLGLFDQHVWTRDPEQTGQRQTRRQRPTTEKESGRWLAAQTATEAALAQGTVITVADREADLFDLFAQERRPDAELLIRAAQNRRVDHPASYLWDAMQSAPHVGTIQVELGRRADRLPEPVTLNLAAQPLQLAPPRNRPQRDGLAPLTVQVLLAREVDPPSGVKPISWLLLTTLAVTTVADAERCLTYYSRRWLIERFHYVLKQGCQIEELQLKEAERLERALATYTLVAWRLLWLTYQARQTPEAPCTVALRTAEWQALYTTVHRTADLPDAPPTLAEAVGWIARLGGFLGRRSDGQPGVKVLWRGWRRLEDLTRMWEVLHAIAAEDMGNA